MKSKLPTPPKQTRPPQKRGLATRDKLISTGMKFLVEYDLTQLRFSQLSKISKVPQSLIDYHFPSMESFLMALIQFKLNQLMDETVGTLEKFKSRPRQALDAYVKVPFRFAQNDKEFTSIWTTYCHLIAVNPNIAGFNSTVQKNGHDRILNLLRSILVHEHLKLNKGIELDDLAYQFHGIITGNLLLAVTNSERDFLKWQRLAQTAVFFIFDKSVSKY